MVRIACIALIPCLVFAQAPKQASTPKPAGTKSKAAPAKQSKPAAAPKAPATSAAAAEEELRARVAEFLQYHVEGNFRKAYEMVAEDTKDEYFATGKMQLKSFTIDSVKLTDNNQKAVVNSTVKRDWQIRMQTSEVVVPMVTTWKIENGKWVWYHDLKGAWLTPMGPSNVEPPKRNADGTIEIPKNLNADVIAAAARSILSGSSIDKNQVRLNVEKASSDKVIFTNGAQGAIRVSLGPMRQIPGFTAALDKYDVSGGEKIGLTLSYDPPENAEKPEPVVVRILTEPLNQAYEISVRFLTADEIAKAEEADAASKAAATKAPEGKPAGPQN